jgi:sigma-B regulation protein RsbU (phosphoserine phosphatase)
LRIERLAQVTTLEVESVWSLLWDELGEIPVAEHTLAAGERLVFYTDGITDRQAPDGSMFEDERLRRAVVASAGQSPSEMVVQLTDTLDRFAAGHEPVEDQTLLIVGME